MSTLRAIRQAIGWREPLSLRLREGTWHATAAGVTASAPTLQTALEKLYRNLMTGENQ